MSWATFPPILVSLRLLVFDLEARRERRTDLFGQMSRKTRYLLTRPHDQYIHNAEPSEVLTDTDIDLLLRRETELIAT